MRKVVFTGCNRRRFLRTAGLTVAAAEAGVSLASATPETASANAGVMTPEVSASFGRD